jgi:eukaryotic-like serine/threonine-protein kinase
VFRIDIAGGPARPLAPAANPQGGTWGADDVIVFAPTTVSPLFKVPASAGKLTEATKLESPSQTNHRRPSFLRGSRQFLFYAAGPGVSSVYLGSLDGGALKQVIAAESAAQVLEPDHIVFAQEGSLVARRFNAARGEVTRDPVMVTARDAAGSRTSMGFSASAAGSLAYRIANAAPPRLTWFDRAGSELGHGADLNGPDVSPDGRYVAYDRTIAGNRDVWIMDLVRGGTTRFTTHAAIDGYRVWSLDGMRLAFHSQRKGTVDIWTKRFDGARERKNSCWKRLTTSGRSTGRGMAASCFINEAIRTSRRRTCSPCR